MVIYLAAATIALNTLVSYKDPAYYYDRRPTIAIPPGQVLQVAPTAPVTYPGIHGWQACEHLQRRPAGGRAAHRVCRSSRSHFRAYDVRQRSRRLVGGSGWLGRYLDTLPRPGGSTSDLEHCRRHTARCNQCSRECGVDSDASSFAYASPNYGQAALDERRRRRRWLPTSPIEARSWRCVNSINLSALETLDRVGGVASPLQADGPLSPLQRLLTRAARRWRAPSHRASRRDVYWVQTGGYDTQLGPGQQRRLLRRIMGTLGDAQWAFYSISATRGCWNDTTVMNSIPSSAAASPRTPAAEPTIRGGRPEAPVLGGMVRGGLHGTAATLTPGHPTLESDSGDVHYETDFRSVYARVLDQWLGVNSVPILNGDFPHRRTRHLLIGRQPSSHEVHFLMI